MNIHDTLAFGPRPKGYKCRNTAEPARTRKGAKFPGGKRLRKALEVLSIRQNTHIPISKPSGHACTKPGSLQAK